MKEKQRQAKAVGPQSVDEGVKKKNWAISANMLAWFKKRALQWEENWG